MATFLYRLGRFTAKHAWLTLVTWLVVLVGLGGAMAAFSSPPSSAISIPGAQFQKVIDDLGEEIPASAGGIGTITIENENGPITPAQRAAIERTLADWEKAPRVTSVMNPFETQAELDDSRGKLADGRKQLEEQSYKLQQGHWLYDQGQKDLAAARKELAALEKAGDGDSQRARELRVEIPAREKGNAEIKAQLDDGDAKIADARKQVSQGQSLLGMSEGLRFVSEDGSTVMLQIQYDDAIAQLSPEVRAEVPAIGTQLEDSGLRVDYNADILQTRSIVGIGEVIGLGIAAVVLLVMLGSLIAAGLPLLVALVGVGAGLLAAMTATAFFDMNSMTPALALMLGLAVGIDYALFIVNRHRQQLLDGMELHHSIGLATGTAGNAVVVAGTTVIIALSALTVSGLPILAQMGLVAAGTVAMTVLVALTVAPAVLRLMGRRVISKRTWRKHEAAQATATTDDDPTPTGSRRGSGRWAVLVTNHPWRAIAATVVAIALLAIPAFSLRLGLPDGSSEPKDSSAFHSYVTIEKDFGPGANGPIVAVASFDEPLTAAEVPQKQAEVGRDLYNLVGVERVVPFGVSEDRDTLAFQVVPSEGPTSESTVELVSTMNALADRMPEGVELGITGQTVANIEISQRLADALPLYVALVVGLSLLLLMAVFRSVLVPLVATAGFLLSVAAGFGSVVAVYQWGFLGDLLQVSRPGPIMPFMPTLLIGVLFGLAMDYQMFLVSGMHEARAHGQSSRDAIRTGFRQGYRVVVAAALIMIAVFAGFVFAHLSMIRPMGLGLAVGVAVDAFLVRMTLTPAVLHLLGDRAWWIPRWLDRILPDLDVEGTKLRARLERDETSPREEDTAYDTDDETEPDDGEPATTPDDDRELSPAH
ncbi:RND superfamily putative drug exporter [Knoellia remsis]|uniref:RND superfamily putative drug exporter n=1 Tax=Knoellia remsis TaxID=407159 RepID=A0A2T0UGP6_9MICO|nr:MMPL family transporter [Knoellia remsis]PRY57115.1 RND superfamily putative drug exporter [Knoellia remsis]